MQSDLALGIKKTLCILNEMRSEKIIGRYAIGGAVAAYIYIEPAFTSDIDIFVLMEDDGGFDPLRPIIEWLKSKGHTEFDGAGIMISGWSVQFIPANKALEKDALAKAISTDIEGVETRIFSQEHLMAICLQTGRPKDKGRLALFLTNDSYDKVIFLEIINRFDLASKWTTFKAEMSEL